MKSIRAGEILRIESRKHGGAFHRSWKRSVVLDPGEPLLLANRDVEVTESDGHKWFSKGLALCQFHRNHWFNTIIMIDTTGSHRFYCNIASPCSLESHGLVYTDYDLDLLVEPDLTYRWLDRDDYERNRSRLGYSREITQRVEEAVSQLEHLVTEGKEPFTSGFVQKGVHRFLSYEKQLMG
ncbi:UPF0374 protein YgaC [Kroppenstedtia guangzhouensis]|uniref:UPF0374 protein YgaC n=1 Tax=Kroppenstedtia guangzhouensis TaxID=1274356 RepID=A0ABQ1GVI0_9BACL|nr:DUF402 domain-containing protein [Kroppenstedtia guangzhouensis]GGA50743.1 UPF0374 protein YgaC [Kroppenstedtia guangzhouensis]